MEIWSLENLIAMNKIFILLSFLSQSKSAAEVDWNEENENVNRLFFQVYESARKYNDIKDLNCSHSCSPCPDPFNDFDVNFYYLQLKAQQMPKSSNFIFITPAFSEYSSENLLVFQASSEDKVLRKLDKILLFLDV